MKKCCKNYVIVFIPIGFVVKLMFSFRFIFFKSKLDNSKLFSKLRLPHGTSERGSAGQIIIDFIINNAQASRPLRPEYHKRHKIVPAPPTAWECTIGWVNSYQKWEIKKYTVCGNLILPKTRKGILKKKFATTGMQICIDLRIFASFLYPTLICTQNFY